MKLSKADRIKRHETFERWWTNKETSFDTRTGAVAEIEEVRSINGTWEWYLTFQHNGKKVHALARSQKAARKKARDMAMVLPDHKEPKKR